MALVIMLCVLDTCSGLWDSECQMNSGEKCENDPGKFVVESNKICPSPITAGSTLSAFWSGTFLSAQNITSIKLKVYYSSVLVKTVNSQFEGFYEENEYENFEIHFEIPSYSPSGEYTILSGLINSEDEQINCWESYITITN